MDPLTHVAAGVGLSRFIAAPQPRPAILAALGFALLPDLDFVLLFFDRLSYLQHHRGLTHSLVALPVFALLGGLLAWRLGGRRWFRPIVLLGAAVLASHLFLDLATSYGIQLLSPFSRRKFSLDLLFIVDPLLTLLLAAGALTALLRPHRRRLAALALGLAGGYLLVCTFYQHQALALARGLGEPEAVNAAALPQPLSCRRWHLIAASPAGWREAFVEFPWWPGDSGSGLQLVREVTALPEVPPRTPAVPFGRPRDLLVVNWRPRTLGVEPDPEARRFLHLFLEFARFPHLAVVERGPGMVSATWVDLRFSLPGGVFPFALTLDLDHQGRLLACDWGRGRRWGFFSRPRTAAWTGESPGTPLPAP